MATLALTTQIRLLVSIDLILATLARRSAGRRDAGEVTSQMILIAVFATLAIAVGGIIYAKVTQTATNVPTDIGPATVG